MKSNNCLIQRIRRIIRQHTLEITECNCALVKMLRLLYHIITGSIRNKLIRTPIVSIRITVIWLAIICRNHIQRLPLRISAILNDLLPEIRRNTHDILHQFRWLLKYIFVHLLQNYLDVTHTRNLECQKICVVNMPVSIGAASHKSSVILKISNYFCYLNW